MSVEIFDATYSTNTRRVSFTLITLLMLQAFLVSERALGTDNAGEHEYVHEHAGAHSQTPIGVMGDHMLQKKGEWMLSFRYMYMDMGGNRIGTDRVSSDFIAQNIPNRFFGMPMQPPTLRIVPTEMTMDMVMFEAMWAPSDWSTVMIMGNYLKKDMKHTTYLGPTGTTVLGTFRTESSGIGDTYLGTMLRLYDAPESKVHLNLGITAPTGSTTETDRVLTPMNMTPTVRIPYAMQLGSGTWDAKPGITYNGHAKNFTWGAQYMGTFRIGDDNGYDWGNVHEVTSWATWSSRAWFSSSVRLAWESRDRINGIDPNIAGPVQTADPNKYGGDSLFGYLGVSLAGQSGGLRGHRLALEVGWPIDQDLNGPQMEVNFHLTAGWQYSFE